MKMRIVLGLCIIALLLTILPDTRTFAAADPIMSVVPMPFPQGGFLPLAPHFTGYPARPQSSLFPLVSAQQACLHGGGWNWRQGQVSMCFRSGHAVCPAGHPWMRQTTQRYTICLSASSPEQFPPAMGIR